jgi:hypothetical protein
MSDFDIHSPEFWAREDRAFDEQMDYYEGQPLTENTRATLLMMAWTEIAQLRVVARTLALEGREPRPRGRPKGNGTPPPKREIPVVANEGRVELGNRKLSADEARELGARLIQAADALDSGQPEGEA